MKLALIGDPVEHSASPALHRELMDGARIAGSYEALRVPAGGCAAAIEDLRGRGYRGLNVTTPLKEEASDACPHRDEVARRTGSVNTIVFEDGGLTLGCNTDGLGAWNAIAEAIGKELLAPETNVLVLGAGPTARAAAYVLSRSAWARVYLWNRRRERALELAHRFALDVWSGEPVAVAFAALPPHADLDDAVMRALKTAPVVVDANYGPRATLGTALGRTVVDGMTMLRASARASFALWLDVERLRRGGDSNSRDL
jgi:shikimate dehydrogenase